MTTTSSVPESKPSRGWFLTVWAILLWVLAFSDFTKAIQHARDPRGTLGFVFFGYRFDTVAGNAIAGPLFGVILAAYAFGIWRLRRWSLPLGMIYAFYVPLNLVLFWFTHPRLGQEPSIGFIIFYLAIALTGSIGTALYLAYHRERLG